MVLPGLDNSRFDKDNANFLCYKGTVLYYIVSEQIRREDE